MSTLTQPLGWTVDMEQTIVQGSAARVAVWQRPYKRVWLHVKRMVLFSRRFIQAIGVIFVGVQTLIRTIITTRVGLRLEFMCLVQRACPAPTGDSVADRRPAAYTSTSRPYTIYFINRPCPLPRLPRTQQS